MGIRAGTRDLAGDRWTALVETIRFIGLDLTNAVMEAHVRLTPDTPGAALIDLDTVTTANTQGLRLVSVATEDGVKVSTVLLQVNETTMEALPAANETGNDAVLAWDFLSTLDGALNPGLTTLKQRYLKGKFTVEAGSTQ